MSRILKILLALFVYGSVCAQGNRPARSRSITQPTPPSEVVHPGDVPGEVTPEQLQFLLDLGGDGTDPEMPLYMEAATQFAIEKHAKVQKNGFVAAGLHILEVPKRADRPRPTRRGYSEEQRRRVAQLTAQEQAEQNKRLRMLATGHHIVAELSDAQKETLLSQFEEFHWKFLGEAVPQMLEEWPYEGLLSWTRPNWTYLEKFGLNEDSYFKQETRESVRVNARHSRVVVHPANYRNTEGLSILIGGMFHGGFLPEEKLIPEIQGESATAQLNAWKETHLGELKSAVMSVQEWLRFTEENQIIREFDTDGNPVFYVLEDGEKKALNNALEKAVVEPWLKALVQNRGIQGWLKFVGESKFGPRLVQFAIQTTDLGRAIAGTAVHVLEQVLKEKRRPLVVKPEFLTHKFAQTVQDFAQKFDIKSFQNYTAESAARTANLRDLDRAGLSKASGMHLFGKAFARAFALEAAIDIAFRLGGAAYNGLGDEVTIGGEEYQVGGRDRIQMTGDAGRDAVRQRSAAISDAWEDWKRNGLQNTAGYVAGGLATAVATPFVFGVAAAAGAPTAGVGSVVVAVAGYAVVGAVAYGASQGARSIFEGVDDGVNLLRIKDRLNGIYLDMAINRNGQLSQGESLVSRIVEAARLRYQNRQNMKYMVFVDDFSNVELTKEGSLTHFKIHQDHGNFVDSARVDSWENWFKEQAMDIGTLGVSRAWRAFSDWYQGEDARIENREARILHDFYDLAGNQAQWDDYPDKIVPVGPIETKGVVFVGTEGDQIEFSSSNIIRGTEDNSDLRILSNGLIMARNERNRERWVIKGQCSEFDVFVREEASERSGRYTCLNNTLRYLEHLNRLAPSVASSNSVSVPVDTTSVQGQENSTGALDEAFLVIAP